MGHLLFVCVHFQNNALIIKPWGVYVRALLSNVSFNLRTPLVTVLLLHLYEKLYLSVCATVNSFFVQVVITDYLLVSLRLKGGVQTNLFSH